MSVLVQVLDLSVASSSASFLCAEASRACSKRSPTRATIMWPSALHPRLSAGINERTVGTRQRTARRERNGFIGPHGLGAWSRNETLCYHPAGHHGRRAWRNELTTAASTSAPTAWRCR